MEKNMTREELIRTLIDRDDSDPTETEELMHLLLAHRISDDLKEQREQSATKGERLSDSIARFAGSWLFIGVFCAVLLCWMVVNVLLATNAFDPYPFILLNLALSCVAAVQAPLIMMSQNRQEGRDRLRDESSYKLSLKSELILEDLHEKLDRLAEAVERLEREGKRQN